MANEHGKLDPQKVEDRLAMARSDEVRDNVELGALLIQGAQQERIYRGEMEVTDGDGVQTMLDCG